MINAVVFGMTSKVCAGGAKSRKEERAQKVMAGDGRPKTVRDRAVGWLDESSAEFRSFFSEEEVEAPPRRSRSGRHLGGDGDTDSDGEVRSRTDCEVRPHGTVRWKKVAKIKLFVQRLLFCRVQTLSSFSFCGREFLCAGGRSS